MPAFEDEFRLILNHTVRVGRRSGFTTTVMGDRRPTGETTIVAALSCYFDYTSGKFVMDPAGNFTEQDYVMFARYNVDLQPGDLIYPVTNVVGLTLGRVLTVNPQMDFDGNTHHIEAAIERIA